MPKKNVSTAEITGRSTTIQACVTNQLGAICTASALVAASPRNTEALYALADVYAGLGDLASSRAATPDARAWYEKSLSTWRQVPNPAHVSPKGFDVTRPQDIERRLARLSGRRP